MRQFFCALKCVVYHVLNRLGDRQDGDREDPHVPPGLGVRSHQSAAATQGGPRADMLRYPHISTLLT